MFEALAAEMERAVVERDGYALFSVSVSGNLYRERTRGYDRLTGWVAETFAAHGVSHLALDPLFRERIRREGRYPAWENDAHWNETGHAWAAEAIYPEIARRLAPRHEREPGADAGTRRGS